MTKFEKVKKALEEVTMNTGNHLTITKNVDARHSGVYAIKNVRTNNVGNISYKTLNEIVKEYELKI